VSPYNDRQLVYMSDKRQTLFIYQIYKKGIMNFKKQQSDVKLTPSNVSFPATT